MRLGASLFLIAVGAILYFAVTATLVGIDIQTVGLILMIIGVIGFALSFFLEPGVAPRLLLTGEPEGATPMIDDKAALTSSPGRNAGNGRQSKPKAVVHLTVAERAEKGKAARLAAPRSRQGEWEPAADRPDPVALLEEQAASRVPELVPIRYGRMLVSPFTFFRGAAYPMAADLAAAPRTGLRRAAVRRCAPVQLRRLRRARPAAGVQHQRLRRDAAGPVRVGRQAAGGQLRRGRPRPRLRREPAADDQPRRSRGPTGRRSGSFAEHVEPRPLVLAHRRGRARRPGGAAGVGEAAQALRAQPGEGAVEGQPAGRSRSSRRSSTASRGSRATRR